jgi:hypothetical protein
VPGLHVVALCGLVWIAISLARSVMSEDASRQIKARQECIASGGSWQEGRVFIFRTESCGRSR